MNRHGKIGRAPDFTSAFLVTAAVVVFCVLAVIWALYGVIAALFAAWLIDLWIKRKPLHHNGIKPTQRP